MPRRLRLGISCAARAAGSDVLEFRRITSASNRLPRHPGCVHPAFPPGSAIFGLRRGAARLAAIAAVSRHLQCRHRMTRSFTLRNGWNIKAPGGASDRMPTVSGRFNESKMWVIGIDNDVL